MKAALAAVLLGWVYPALGALSYSYTGPALSIPDNDASGRTFSFSLSDPATAITSLSISFDISGGYNGDLYAYLSHGSGYTVLLNRTGVGESTSGSSASGYADTGFAITLSSLGGANMHFYRNSSPVFNGSGQLTGTWQPDGRTIDPGSVPSAFDAAGTADFGSFTGVNPNGSWTLYFADLSPGSVATLNSFMLDIQAVPEPVNLALGFFAGVVGATSLYRWRDFRKRRRASLARQQSGF